MLYKINDHMVNKFAFDVHYNCYKKQVFLIC